MFDVRFHLGAGEFYKHWQVKNKENNEVIYYDRKMYYLIMNSCTLKNYRNKAEKVFSTQKRDVCGFIRCLSWEVFPYNEHDTMDYFGDELLYDPKIAPFWHKENSEESYDNMTYGRLITFGRRVFQFP
jgi:hypothetical protein